MQNHALSLCATLLSNVVVRCVCLCLIPACVPVPLQWYVDCISDMLAALPRLQQGLSAAALGDVEAAFRFPVHHQQTTPFPGRAVDTVPVALWGFLVRWQTPKVCLPLLQSR